MRTCQMLYPRNTVMRRAVSMDGMWKFQIDWEQQGYEQNWKDGLPSSDMLPFRQVFRTFTQTRMYGNLPEMFGMRRMYLFRENGKGKKLPSVLGVRRIVQKFM